jgi:Spy/CpxP family protein refolding chaperone
MIGPGAKQRWLGITVLVTTFLAGGVAGAAVRQVTASSEAAKVKATAASDDDDRNRRERRRFPYDELGVGEEQRAQIEAALEQGRDNMAALWHEYEPRMDSVVDSTRARIDALLTPEQRQKYADYRQRRRQHQRDQESRPDSGRERR